MSRVMGELKNRTGHGDDYVAGAIQRRVACRPSTSGSRSGAALLLAPADASDGIATLWCPAPEGAEQPGC